MTRNKLKKLISEKDRIDGIIQSLLPSAHDRLVYFHRPVAAGILQDRQPKPLISADTQKRVDELNEKSAKITNIIVKNWNKVQEYQL